jgi:hypothetical protein
MKSDWTAHLEDTAFALLAAAVLLGVPALSRLSALGDTAAPAGASAAGREGPPDDRGPGGKVGHE